MLWEGNLSLGLELAHNGSIQADEGKITWRRKFGQQPAAQLPWFHIETLLTKVTVASARRYSGEAIPGTSRTQRPCLGGPVQPHWQRDARGVMCHGSDVVTCVRKMRCQLHNVSGASGFCPNDGISASNAVTAKMAAIYRNQTGLLTLYVILTSARPSLTSS